MSYYRSLIQSGPALPIPSNGLQLWISSANFISPGFISQWDDLSGNNNHLLQAVGANQANVILNEKNGLPIVRFNPASFYTLTNPIPANTDRTDFFLIKKTSGDVACSLSNNSLYYSNFINATDFYTTTANVYGQSTGISAIYDVMMHTRTGNTLVHYKNGAGISSSTSSFARTENDFVQFGKLSLSYLSVFDGLEHIFYNRVLTSQEITDVQTYLATKWAL